MSSNNVDNHDENILPFADYEPTIDISFKEFHLSKEKYNHKSKSKNKKTSSSSSQKQSNNIKPHLQNAFSYIYFENTLQENNYLSLIPYTGPSNTLHLNRHLYLPQLISTINNNSIVSYQRFIQEYDQTIATLAPISSTMSFSIYLRFGILYVTHIDSTINRIIPLWEFFRLRNQGKQVKTAFYACKGVTSPKHLLSTITKLHYIPISSNQYFYDIQLYNTKKNINNILHFQYDEQLRCTAIFSRPSYPINFDFIRNKTSSRFRSIDNSYSDIFDFRIQLVQQQFFNKTDQSVLDVLRGIPIDQVLYIDPLTRTLRVASTLQKYVKYLKYTCSSNYENLDEQLLIRIGTYEEYQLNSNGQCESLMEASNTMTIEYLDCQTIPSGKRLYDIGIWFSNLCQTCVDLPTMFNKEKTKTTKWFCDALGKKTNQSIKQMNVNQLTIYRTNKLKSYTNEELTLVKTILQEDNYRNIFIDSNQEKNLDDMYQYLIKRLKTSAVPSANEALQKVERAYLILSKELI